MDNGEEILVDNNAYTGLDDFEQYSKSPSPQPRMKDKIMKQNSKDNSQTDFNINIENSFQDEKDHATSNQDSQGLWTLKYPTKNSENVDLFSLFNTQT